jgi:lipopolysaccharide transport system permease protein
MDSMLQNPISSLYKHRKTLWATSRFDFKARYAGSALGIWWALITPILFLGTYTIIYSVIFKLRPGQMSQPEYILYIFAGLIPFLNFAEALSFGSMSVSANKDLLKNTVFPAELIPVRAILVTLPSFAFSLCILVAASFIIKGYLPIKLLLLPLVVMVQMCLILGLAWLLSPAHLALKDIQYLLQFIIMMLMVASPIAYTADMVPAAFRTLIFLNPLAPLIQAYQYLFVVDTAPALWPLITWGSISILGFVLAFNVFGRIKSLVISNGGI